MSEFTHPTYTRTIPARKPPGFRPAALRATLRWRRPIPYLIAEWFGVQNVEPGDGHATAFVERLLGTFAGEHGPEAFEVLDCPVDEAGMPAVVVVGYWTSVDSHARWSRDPVWSCWWKSDDRLGDAVGYWRETLMCPYERHETVLSHDQYRFGIGRVRDTEIAHMSETGYFGAARDRIPASAFDELKSPLGVDVQLGGDTDPRGYRLIVSTPSNMTVIRSGQFWEDSEPEQTEDYENGLRPKLEKSLDYLSGDPRSGCIYLRRLQSLDVERRPRRETSVYAVFQDFAGLERWTADHTTHQLIHRHQIASGKRYGTRRDLVTWHEAFVLPPDNRFEYINCAPGTGMTRVSSDTAASPH